MNNRTREDYVSLFVENYLKKDTNLPYTIVTRRCSDRNKKCNKHHGEIVVKSYNKEKEYFFVTVYSTHIDKPSGHVKWKSESIQKVILRSIKLRLFNTNDLKRKLDLSSVFRTELLQTKVTIDEKKIIENIVKNKKMTISEYLRKQAIQSIDHI